MKKSLILILVGVLIGSITVLGAANLFSDVPAGTWYTNAVNNLAEKGIINGYSDGTFAPNNNVNRAELAVILDRTLQYIETGQVTDNQTSYLCTDPATTLENGRTVYPIDPKYAQLEFLGQLFTAYNCGPERLSQIFGVEGDNYTLGLTIYFSGPVSDEFISVYNAIGFTCNEVSSGSACKSELSPKKLVLTEIVPVEEIIKLKPFADYLESDDCYICG